MGPESPPSTSEAAPPFTYGNNYRAATYLEIEVYALAQQSARAADISLSKWLRKLVLQKLAEESRISPRMLLELAAA